MNQQLYVVLNTSNSFQSNITLTAPIEANFCRIMSNKEKLITASFLANSYIYDLSNSGINSSNNIALAGSKLAYTVKEKPFYNCLVKKLYLNDNDTDEIQLIFYFFN
jgi:hypothetical protein